MSLEPAFKKKVADKSGVRERERKEYQADLLCCVRMTMDGWTQKRCILCLSMEMLQDVM